MNHEELFVDLKELCNKLTQEQYEEKLEILSGSSIGAHLRHGLEFYVCLSEGMKLDKVNYDERKRDILLETDNQYASKKIEELNTYFSSIKEKKALTMYVGKDSREKAITSLERELIYCYDHMIHHQALIKVGLKELKISNLISANFGVANSTVQFRNSQK